jgi:hypothetical protein
MKLNTSVKIMFVLLLFSTFIYSDEIKEQSMNN